MNSDPLSGAQALRDKQKTWNAGYFQFLTGNQRILAEYGTLFPSVLGEIEGMIRTGQVAEALSCLVTIKQLLADHFRQELEIISAHHKYVEDAMGCYRSMVEAMHSYSLGNQDQDLVQTAEIQLEGLDDFMLATIAYLDPDLG